MGKNIIPRKVLTYAEETTKPGDAYWRIVSN